MFLKKLHREKGEIHIPLFSWQHLASTFHRRIEKKMHGSRHSVHSHPPKQDDWFGGACHSNYLQVSTEKKYL